MSLGSAYFGIAVHDGKVGILDIGSNSVRLVVYDGMKRAPMPIFNEKSMCELGKNLAVTGVLNPEGVEAARVAIARFLTMARVMDVVEIYIIATAAIRDAEDGKAFVREIEKAHGVTVKTISGVQEAKLAAKGVQASLFKPSGLVGDLGGGSFELVRIHDERIFQQATLPLGALRLKDDSKGDMAVAAELVKTQYDELKWLQDYEFETFYAVGGSFRALAHIHLLERGYPLEVLHAYEVSATDLKSFLRTLLALPVEKLAELPGSSKKRAASMHFAAIALGEVLDRISVNKVVFSTAGIREGYLYDQLSPYLKQEDGLIAACVDLASQNGRVESYARDLYHWINPLFTTEDPSLHRIRFAACVLSEFAWRIHPQYRAEWQFTRIIQSSLIGMNHKERVMLAVALYNRHTLNTKFDTKVVELLSRKQMQWCVAVGRALSSGFALSGGMAGILPKAPLKLDKKEQIKITVDEELQDLFTDFVKKRLDGLGEALSAWRSKV